jgi:hypothetical protein
MKDLLQILGIASMSIIWVREFGYRFKKPLSCELCLSFWVTLFWFHSIEGIPLAFLAAASSTIINKYL